METTKQKHPKKVLHSTLMEKITPVLHGIKDTFIVNEHKLEKAVKGAASYIADHLHIGNDKPKKAAAKKKSAPVKKSSPKKAAPKKSIPVKKTAKKAAAKK